MIDVTPAGSFALAVLAPLAAGQGSLQHLTVAWDGGQPNGASTTAPVFSGDGQVVAFATQAGNLVFPFDHNNWSDVYVRILASQTTERISVGMAGFESNHESVRPALSGDGRFVAFDSLASNLVPGDDNGKRDVFIADRQNGAVEWISVDSAGVPGNGDSQDASLSDDGRFVAFASRATNLDPADASGDYSDVYVRDRLLGTTTLASYTWQGLPSAWPSAAPALSADGLLLAFESADANIVPNNSAYWVVALRDFSAGTTINASPTWDGSPSERSSARAAFSGDGRYLAFLSDAANLVPGDVNGHTVDVYVYDTQGQTVELASLSSSGQQVEVFFNFTPTLSADGRWVGFHTSAADVVPGDTNGWSDVFVRDRVAGATLRASLGNFGIQGDAASSHGALSPSATAVAFTSSASTFVAAPGNFTSRVFLRELASQTPEVYCTAKPNSQGCTPLISFTGTPSASAAAPFRIQAAGVINHKPGLLFYGLGFQALPFQGAFLCVATPLTRTIVQLSGGNPPPDDCSGFYSFDFNAHIQSGIDPRLVAGTIADAQYWTRDPADPTGFTTGLTDALHFLIAP
jgi:Tol biopolymer transport system component